ncbi:hypothetical protein RFI_15623 [Reticulomyxa filosa]|uniref:Uncharacterized protein n=1 Tax=Reticulomyxa filosa TaxID=46433 RepID=X6N750_RETFI|nr:hypothetical protein RFI_15623 [Reticulomyxa filosa]|eukprot:ETO21579.1 hypothetical protein RFI_15623 [Reticulomyxa filosa]
MIPSGTTSGGQSSNDGTGSNPSAHFPLASFSNITNSGVHSHVVGQSFAAVTSGNRVNSDNVHKNTSNVKSMRNAGTNANTTALGNGMNNIPTHMNNGNININNSNSNNNNNNNNNNWNNRVKYLNTEEMKKLNEWYPLHERIKVRQLSVPEGCNEKDMTLFEQIPGGIREGLISCFYRKHCFAIFHELKRFIASG